MSRLYDHPRPLFDEEPLHIKEIVEAVVIGFGALVGLVLWMAL